MYIRKRIINEDNIIQFSQKLEEIWWHFDASNPNESYDIFIESLLNVYNECFPFKVLNMTNRNRKYKPWITREIRKLCKKKCKMYKKYVKNPTEYRKSVYKKIRNKVTNLIKKTKAEYYITQFNQRQSATLS